MELLQNSILIKLAPVTFKVTVRINIAVTFTVSHIQSLLCFYKQANKRKPAEEAVHLLLDHIKKDDYDNIDIKKGGRE